MIPRRKVFIVLGYYVASIVMLPITDFPFLLMSLSFLHDIPFTPFCSLTLLFSSFPSCLSISPVSSFHHFWIFSILMSLQLPSTFYSRNAAYSF